MRPGRKFATMPSAMPCKLPQSPCNIYTLVWRQRACAPSPSVPRADLKCSSPRSLILPLVPSNYWFGCATALNRADTLQRRGQYPPPLGESDILGLELAGEVETVGTMTQGFRVGDRVFGLIGGGGYAEKAVIDYRMAMPIPASWSFVEAAPYRKSSLRPMRPCSRWVNSRLARRC